MEKVVHKYKLGEEPDEIEFWKDQSPEKRIEALTRIRERWIKLKHQDQYGKGLSRVYRVTKQA